MRRGVEELHHALGSLRLGEGLMGQYAVVESVRSAEVQQEGEVVVGLAGVKVLKDVRARGEEGYELGFLDEALAVSGVGVTALVDDLAGGQGVVGRGEAAEYRRPPPFSPSWLVATMLKCVFTLRSLSPILFLSWSSWLSSF
ncbi:hypothetical protein NL676_020419 [Syzygium grande]|nr:hypothetical protein NL676_020419 [Syzygium grande]